MTEHWLDVSRWQGTIDWDKVKTAGVQGAIVKAGGGDAGIYTDPQFARNWAECQRVGLQRGAYWFAGGLDATQEAQHFLGLLTGMTVADVIAADFEGSNHYQQWGKTFMGLLPAPIARQWVYGNAGFLALSLGGDPYYAQFALWLAGYPNYLYIPAPWKTVAAHQYTDAFSCPGIAGNVDASWVYTPPSPNKHLGGSGSMTTNLSDGTTRTVLRGTDGHVYEEQADGYGVIQRIVDRAAVTIAQPWCSLTPDGHFRIDCIGLDGQHYVYIEGVHDFAVVGQANLFTGDAGEVGPKGDPGPAGPPGPPSTTVPVHSHAVNGTAK